MDCCHLTVDERLLLLRRCFLFLHFSLQTLPCFPAFQAASFFKTIENLSRPPLYEHIPTDIWSVCGWQNEHLTFPARQRLDKATNKDLCEDTEDSSFASLLRFHTSFFFFFPILRAKSSSRSLPSNDLMRERERERERDREGECERDKMRDNCSTRLYSSTSVIKRKTLRSVVFILLIIFLKSILNPTIIVICLFM